MANGILLFERHVDRRVTAGPGGIDGLGYSACGQPDHRPLGVPENDERNPARSQVLLVADVLVGRDNHVEARPFGRLDQIAVGEFLPSAGTRLFDDMAIEEPCQPARHPVIEEDEHLWN